MFSFKKVKIVHKRYNLRNKKIIEGIKALAAKIKNVYVVNYKGYPYWAILTAKSIFLYT